MRFWQSFSEHHNIAELGEGEWRALGLVGIVRHAQQSDEYSHEYCAKHGVVDHLPMVVIGKPCRNPSANLSEQHKEEIDDRLTCLLLCVESIPSCFVLRFVARRNVARCLDAEAILDECEEVAHEQCLSHESHNKTVESEHKHAVGVGTDITLYSQDGESHKTHHLLPSHAHQGIEERRERRHAYRSGETDEGNMFRLDAKPTHHLTTVDGICTANGHDRYEKDHEEDDAKGFWHPVVERKILRQLL